MGLRVRLPSATVALAALGVLLALWCLSPDIVRGGLRERAFDLVLPLVRGSAPVDPAIAIVDIDHATLARFGPWPWPRARLAQLLGAVAAAKPRAVGLDILLAGPDRFSATALLESLLPGEDRTGLAGLVATLPSGDMLLQQVLSATPTALGFVFAADAAGQALPTTPILMQAAVRLPQIWRSDGIAGPEAALAQAGQGLGALVAAPDADGAIRRVPLLVLAGGALRPGLGVEVVRLAQQAGALLIDAEGRLLIGDARVPLGRDAELRLVQHPPAIWSARTISAAALLDQPATGAGLADKIVLIGGSAPELGGLRVTPAFAATPSVQIQAEAVSTLLGALLGEGVAWRPAWLEDAETFCAAGLGLLGILFALGLRPATAAALTVLTCLAWAGAAVAAVPGRSWLVDPVGPAAICLGSYAAAALARFVRDEWRARLLQASFEQHLAPEIVRRITADPGALRLRGEMREITALFTDIEGFTSMTERAGPVDLVALLDAYFDAVTQIVIDHGGMVEKFVGDAVHAIFNAPFALDQHPQRAVACAIAVLKASEQVRSSPLGQRLQLGRTRIGIETGNVIVGDVGGSRKLDYTAHGDTMNRAARLEAANKELGSCICIGPGTAARLAPASLRSLGTITVRGQSRPVEVFTPVELGADKAA